MTASVPVVVHVRSHQVLAASSRVRRVGLAVLLTMLAPAVLVGCGSGAKARPSSALPSVVGAYGSKPTFGFEGATPPTTLQSKVLRAGTGRTVANGDLLVADYLGQVWRGAVFDNSYDRQAPAGFVIGRGKVITGWDDLLVGVKVGSRLELSVPPDKGYGATGNARVGIKGSDTLVFVVDVVAAYNRSARGDARAVLQRVATPGVTVTGALGAPPKVTVGKGAKAPATPTLTVLAKGTGAPVRTGLLVVQYVATRYTGARGGSTFSRGTPAGVTVTAASGRPFNLARGVPLGSRILLEVPGSKASAAVAVVVDLIAQPTRAALAG